MFAFSLLSAPALAALEVDVSVGVWPLDAPVHDLRDPLLERTAPPEPTLRLQFVAETPRRTALRGGVQLDWIRRAWTYQGALLHEYDAARIDMQFGARTTLGPLERERTRVWIDWGGGFALSVSHGTTVDVAWAGASMGPSAQLGLGLAHGAGRVQGFAEVFGRLGPISTGGIVDCASAPCPQTSSSPAGPGLAILAGAAFR